MKFQQEVINGVVAKLGKYFDIEVEFGNTLFTVYAEGSKAISEFESRLVFAQMETDGDTDGENVNAVIMLDELVNLVDKRDVFGPQVTREGSWMARYLTIPYED